MLALFLTLTVALALLSWAELAPRRAGRDGVPSGGSRSDGAQAEGAPAPDAAAPVVPPATEHPPMPEVPPAAAEAEHDALMARLAALLDTRTPEASPQTASAPAASTTTAPQPTAART
ncbi:MAG: hypothetical protein IE922_07860, partial [Sphingomonadales bacterium]|nr:hypothetical protein [Sphingomonadales bacterium]